MLRLLVATLMTATLVVCPAWATTIHVPGDQPTIQAGIDAAVAGDTVLVECGTYYEHDIVMKSGVSLRSETGEADCVTVDAQQQGSVILCDGVDSLAVVQGFRITGGFSAEGGPSLGGAGIALNLSSPKILSCFFDSNTANGHGGGLDCYDGSFPEIRDCVFSGNYAGFRGGAIRCNFSSPIIEGCLFEQNTAGYSGGGLYCRDGSPQLSGCVFLTNDASEDGGAVRCYHISSPTFSACVFGGNSSLNGGAVMCYNASVPSFDHCTFYGNSATGSGSAFYCWSTYSPDISASVIADGVGGGAVYSDGVQSTPVFSCCDIYGNAGGDWAGHIASQLGVDGNISADPMFCDPDNGNFMLDVMSPCAPDNNSCSVLIGACPVGCGASPVEVTSWGRVKAMYR